jgi:hypothetical protein
MQKRYAQANRKERGRLLDEMEAVTDMHRKGLIRLMNGSLERKPRCRERGKTYGSEVDDALRIIDETLDFVCAERITPNLVWMASLLETHGEIEATPLLLEQLSQISISTVGRRLSRDPPGSASSAAQEAESPQGDAERHPHASYPLE